MANKTKSVAKKKKGGLVRRARDAYGKALCNCGGGGVVNCTENKVRVSKEIGGEDLRGLMQLLSMGNGGGAKVDVDSEGNIVWRRAAEETSYGGGVGRIGRIDEEKPCFFKEDDVFNKKYSRTGSDVKNNSTTISIRRLAY